MTQVGRKIKQNKQKRWNWFPLDRQFEMKHTVEGALESLTTPQLNIIGFLRGSPHPIFFYSQSKLAQHLGLCRATINRNIKQLVHMGLIHYIYRHRKTTLYRLAAVFEYQWFKDILYRVFCCFNFLSISLLCITAPVEDIHSRVTPKFKFKNELFKKSVSSEVRRGRCMTKVPAPPPKIIKPKPTEQEITQNKYRRVLELDREIRTFHETIAKGPGQFPIFADLSMNFLSKRLQGLEIELQELLGSLPNFQQSFIKG